MEYIDFHTHILPGIDDGSRSAGLSQSMLESLYRQNVRTVLLTPHYYSDSIYLKEFVSKRERAYDSLKRVLTDEMPELIISAETYLSKYIFNNNDLTPVCIGDTRNILLEMPFNSRITGQTLDMVYRVMTDYNVTPVLAHVDRYSDMMNDIGLFDEFLNMGCHTQMNISSLMIRPLKKRLLQLIESGRISALGTDTHNMSTRPPDYTDGLKIIQDKLGVGCVEALMTSSIELIK